MDSHFVQLWLLAVVEPRVPPEYPQMSAFAILGLHQVPSYRCHNRATVGGGTYPTEPSLPSISRHQNRLLGDIAAVRPHCVSKRSVQPSPPHTQIMASSMLRSMLAATQKHIHLHQRQLRTTSRVAYDAQLLHLEFFWSFAQQVSSKGERPHHLFDILCIAYDVRHA